MNQIETTEKLQRLYPEDGGSQFEVVFTGCKNKRINGNYNPTTHVIQIHNLNFKNDGALMYTAIHELGHYVAYQKYGSAGRGHPSLFWAIFHDLLDKAEKEKIWKPTEHSIDQVQLMDELQDLLTQTTSLERQIGAKLTQLHISTEIDGGRIEDFIDRDLRITRKTSRVFQQMKLRLDDTYNPDAAQLIVTSKKDVTAESSLADGRSLDQTKQAVKGIFDRIDVIPRDVLHAQKIKQKVDDYKKLIARRETLAARELSLATELKQLGVTING